MVFLTKVRLSVVITVPRHSVPRPETFDNERVSGGGDGEGPPTWSQARPPRPSPALAPPRTGELRGRGGERGREGSPGVTKSSSP